MSNTHQPAWIPTANKPNWGCMPVPFILLRPSVWTNDKHKLSLRFVFRSIWISWDKIDHEQPLHSVMSYRNTLRTWWGQGVWCLERSTNSCNCLAFVGAILWRTTQSSTSSSPGLSKSGQQAWTKLSICSPQRAIADETPFSMSIVVQGGLAINLYWYVTRGTGICIWFIYM